MARRPDCGRDTDAAVWEISFLGAVWFASANVNACLILVVAFDTVNFVGTVETVIHFIYTFPTPQNVYKSLMSECTTPQSRLACLMAALLEHVLYEVVDLHDSARVRMQTDRACVAGSSSTMCTSPCGPSLVTGRQLKRPRPRWSRVSGPELCRTMLYYI